MSNKELQPKDYRYVVFSDDAANFSFLTKSTAQSEETIKWTDGKEYPLVKIQISSASHPFFTGEEKIASKLALQKLLLLKANLATKLRKLKKKLSAKLLKLKRTLNHKKSRLRARFLLVYSTL